MTDLPVPLDAYPGEQQIFMPYFLFHWDPQRPRSGKGAIWRGGIVTRWYELEKGGRLSELERLFLEQATTQPLSFFEVLRSEEHTSELQSRFDLVCRLLLEKKKKNK